MSKSKKNISVKKPSDKREELKDFLKDNLSDELLYAFENSRDDAFVKDALEGLAAFSTTENIKKHTQSLNKKLVNSAAGKKKSKALQPSQTWFIIITVVTVILLLMLAYAVISHLK
ncbi:MAG: hypothetical protein PW786_15230 [Arachidicoccus sp.]|nr:hypothetical protein [Arachidicoccus sp.]